MLEDHLAEALDLLKKHLQHRCKMEIVLLVDLTLELPFLNNVTNSENELLIFHVDLIGTKFYVILDGQVEVLIKRRGYDELESVRILKQVNRQESQLLFIVSQDQQPFDVQLIVVLLFQIY